MRRISIALSVVLLSFVAGYPLLTLGGETSPNPTQNVDPALLPPPPPPPMGEARQFTPPPIKTIVPGEYEIGGIHILKKEKRVEFPCKVNMDKGLLEYVIVGSTGKVHESLLRTDVEPYSLQIALLLIGLEGTNNPLSRQGDPATPTGDRVNIWLRWKDGDQVKKARIEEWVVVGQESKKQMQETQWVFTGSMVHDGVFAAQMEKSIAAIYHDPAALIDNPLPEGDSDKVWFVNEGKVPPVGSDVTVTIEKG